MPEHTHLSAGPRALASTTHHTKLRKADNTGLDHSGSGGTGVAMHTSGLRRRGRPAAPPVVPDWGPNWSPSCGLVTGFAFTRRWLCSSDRECDEYEEGDLAHRGEAISPECLITGKQYIDRWPIHLFGYIPTTSIPTMLGADAESDVPLGGVSDLHRVLFSELC